MLLLTSFDSFGYGFEMVQNGSNVLPLCPIGLGDLGQVVGKVS